MTVEKVWDELWVAEKFQSNSEIAGSPRNSFRTSLERIIYGGRALKELGVKPDYRTLSNSEYHIEETQESDCGSSVPWSKGKEPRPSIKVPKI